MTNIPAAAAKVRRVRNSVSRDKMCINSALTRSATGSKSI
jgi:hypothetical protein